MMDRLLYSKLLTYLLLLLGIGHGQAHPNRRLQLFTVDFSIAWDIAIGNGATDRQPTQEEYEWVGQATQDWFESSIEDNFDDVDTEGVDCTLVPSQSAWNPSDTEFPHRILFNCQATFEADSQDLVPTAVDLLVTLNDNSNVRDFIVDYLLVTGEGSIFQFSQTISYTTSTSPIIDGGGGDGPGSTPAPQPIPSFDGTWWLPFRVTLNLGVDADVEDRQPTQEEYVGLQFQVQQWFLDSLRAAYAEEEDFFVTEILSSIESTTYDPTVTNSLSHTIVLDAHAVYNADAREDIPTRGDFFTTIRSNTLDVTRLLTDYLSFAQPDGSIFREVISGQFASEENGPVIAIGNTPSPVAPPSTPVPTPAPIPFTPTPVNPNNIVYTVPTISNWTYFLSEFDEDRQPTQDEYAGLVESTNEWLNLIYNDFYNVNNQDQNLPKFVSLETKLLQGIYNPTAEPPHVVIMSFDITFELDASDETEVIPHIDDIFDVIQEADFDQYISLYVHTSEPIDGSLFQGVSEVVWVYSVEDYTYVPRPTRPPSEMDIPTEGEPGDTGVDRSRFVDAQGVPVSLEFRLRVFNPDLYSAATQEEWDGLAETMRTFWIETLTKQYQSNPDVDFVIVDAKWQVDSTAYDPSQEFPYVGRLLTDVLFTAGSTRPTAVDLRQQMSASIPGSGLVANYIQNAMPVGSLFRQTEEIQWGF